MLDYSARFDVRGKALFVNFLTAKDLADWFCGSTSSSPARATGA
jgi:hypothetical protein